MSLFRMSIIPLLMLLMTGPSFAVNTITATIVHEGSGGNRAGVSLDDNGHLVWYEPYSKNLYIKDLINDTLVTRNIPDFGNGAPFAPATIDQITDTIYIANQYAAGFRGYDLLGNETWTYTANNIESLGTFALSNTSDGINFSAYNKMYINGYDSSGRTFFGFDTSTNPIGVIDFDFTGENPIFITSQPPIIGSDGTIYQANWYVKIFAIDPTSGSLKWTINTHGGGGNYLSGSPVIGKEIRNDGYGDYEVEMLYVVARSGWVYGINTTALAGGATCSINYPSADCIDWMVNLRIDGVAPGFEGITVYPYKSPVLSEDGYLYISTVDTGSLGHLFAIDINAPTLGGHGREVKGVIGSDEECTLPCANSSFEMAISADGTVIADCYSDQTIMQGYHAYDPIMWAQGCRKWEAVLPDQYVSLGHGRFTSGAIAIDEDGKIYGSTLHGIVFAIDAQGGGLADGGWPTYHMDNARSGMAR